MKKWYESRVEFLALLWFHGSIRALSVATGDSTALISHWMRRHNISHSKVRKALLQEKSTPSENPTALADFLKLFSAEYYDLFEQRPIQTDSPPQTTQEAAEYHEATNICPLCAKDGIRRTERVPEIGDFIQHLFECGTILKRDGYIIEGVACAKFTAKKVGV